MTTSSISTPPPAPTSSRRSPRPSRIAIRPLAFLAVAAVLALGTFGLQRVGLFGPSNPARPAAAATAPARAASAGPANGGTGTPLAGDPLDLGIAAPVTDTTDLTKAIGVWTGNLARDPEDFLSAQNLAVVYYTRGRLTGSADDYARAQEAVDQSLAAYPDNAGAKTLRALLQYTLHDFQAALDSAQAIYRADPTALQALATIGDSQLELGRYDDAASSFQTLAKAQPGAAVTARLARLAALRGDDAGAAALAARATREARAEGADGPSFAFYPYLQGYLAFQAGRLDEAIAAHRAAIAAWPGSHLAHEGLARALAATGDLDGAIAEYRTAVAIVPQPEYLAGLADLYTLTGRPELAARQVATVRAIAGLQAKLYNRQLVLFDVNHGQRLDEALTLAENEIAVRKDVYGWDAYAWALLANGRPADAEDAIAHARSLGTHDPLLDYHAGMIAAATGDAARARTLLQSALDRNPGFDPLQAPRAKATLDDLGTR
jgi:tetratricopeptide (TPR) repeat protein